MNRSAVRAKRKKVKVVIQFIAGVTALILASKDFVHEVKDAVKPFQSCGKIGCVNAAN